MNLSIRRQPETADDAASSIERAQQLAPGFAERAPLHDRAASFPFENFQELSDAGLLALTVPFVLGGGGVGVREAAQVVNIVAQVHHDLTGIRNQHRPVQLV